MTEHQSNLLDEAKSTLSTRKIGIYSQPSKQYSAEQNSNWISNLIRIIVDACETVKLNFLFLKVFESIKVASHRVKLMQIYLNQNR